MIDPQQLADLRAKAEAATKGPWCMDDGIEVDYGPSGEPEQFQARPPAVTGIGIDPDSLENYSDAIFIAAANPATVLALLDEIERLRERVKVLERVREAANTLREVCSVFGGNEHAVGAAVHELDRSIDAAKEQP